MSTSLCPNRLHKAKLSLNGWPLWTAGADLGLGGDGGRGYHKFPYHMDMDSYFTMDKARQHDPNEVIAEIVRSGQDCKAITRPQPTCVRKATMGRREASAPSPCLLLTVSWQNRVRLSQHPRTGLLSHVALDLYIFFLAQGCNVGTPPANSGPLFQQPVPQYACDCALPCSAPGPYRFGDEHLKDALGTLLDFSSPLDREPPRDNRWTPACNCNRQVPWQANDCSSKIHP